jgi:hypothetical protein
MAIIEVLAYLLWVVVIVTIDVLANLLWVAVMVTIALWFLSGWLLEKWKAFWEWNKAPLVRTRPTEIGIKLAIVLSLVLGGVASHAETGGTAPFKALLLILAAGLAFYLILWNFEDLSKKTSAIAAPFPEKEEAEDDCPSRK